ncbi:hypothetical protein GJ496_000100 [Pomphorhynchus laevis]|nr:hypothetical protein GJ496_000100 [Pomphorhynchus laevis]
MNLIQLVVWISLRPFIDDILSEDCFTVDKEYNGTVNVSITNLQCLPWKYGPSTAVAYNHNYCRKLNKSIPWCIVQDGNATKQESCYIPLCRQYRTINQSSDNASDSESIKIVYNSFNDLLKFKCNSSDQCRKLIVNSRCNLKTNRCECNGDGVSKSMRLVKVMNKNNNYVFSCINSQYLKKCRSSDDCISTDNKSHISCHHGKCSCNQQRRLFSVPDNETYIRVYDSEKGCISVDLAQYNDTCTTRVCNYQSYNLECLQIGNSGRRCTCSPDIPLMLRRFRFNLEIGRFECAVKSGFMGQCERNTDCPEYFHCVSYKYENGEVRNLCRCQAQITRYIGMNDEIGQCVPCNRGDKTLCSCSQTENMYWNGHECTKTSTYGQFCQLGIIHCSLSLKCNTDNVCVCERGTFWNGKKCTICSENEINFKQSCVVMVTIPTKDFEHCTHDCFGYRINSSLITFRDHNDLSEFVFILTSKLSDFKELQSKRFYIGYQITYRPPLNCTLKGECDRGLKCYAKNGKQASCYNNSFFREYLWCLVDGDGLTWDVCGLDLYKGLKVLKWSVKSGPYFPLSVKEAGVNLECISNFDMNRVHESTACLAIQLWPKSNSLQDYIECKVKFLHLVDCKEYHPYICSRSQWVTSDFKNAMEIHID